MTGDQELRVGSRVNARVLKLMPFGAFVEIEALALIGLIRITELSAQPIKHPQDVLSVGQVIQAEILAFGPEAKQISLSLKRCQQAGE